MNYDYLFDKNFLRLLDLYPHRTVYGKITLLTQDEAPVSEIQGKIISGSINIDGASAVRRTCSLTMIAQNMDLTDNHWALKNKFKLDIGIENYIDDKYPKIIWFKQGIYYFTNLNISIQSTNYTINLSGNDKMSQLNGSIGGHLVSSVDFGKIEEIEKIYNKIKITNKNYIKNKFYWNNNGVYELDTDENYTEDREYFSMEIIRTLTPISIKNIIKEVIHTYGKEKLENIIINDIDEYGLELLEYRGNEFLYMLRNHDSGEVDQVTFNENFKIYKSGSENPITISSLKEDEYYDRTQQSQNNNVADVTLNKNDSIIYNIIRIKSNETVGYRKTDLTYPGELIGNVGETLTSILDKIKKMFADFEYFYDLDGRFVFQKKKTYINNSWNPSYKKDQEIYLEDPITANSYIYSFNDDNLITAFSNNPNILNIKNDFSIWGSRKGSSGADIPIHIRYVIDKKPTHYTPLRFKYQQASVDENNYQANKYYIYSSTINKYTLCTEAQYQPGVQYYLETNEQDLTVIPFTSKDYDCRELIYQMALDYFKYSHNKENFEILIKNANPKHYPTGITGYESYYTDLYSFWRQIYNPEAIGKEKEWVELSIAPENITTALFSSKTGFVKEYTTAPETLNFDFDFLDVKAELGKYQISQIGQRTKSINDSAVTAIYFQETPNVLFKTLEEESEYASGYTTIQLPKEYENYFSISAQGLSAKDKLYELLNEHISYAENITITSIPIYHLEPNTRIYVSNKASNIEGEYIVNKITIPLGYNETSSINAIKVINKVY